MAHTARGRSEVEIEWQLDALDLRPVERWLEARCAGGDVAAATGAPGSPGGGDRDETAGERAPDSSDASVTIRTFGEERGPGVSVTAEPAPAGRLLDLYYDTEDWRLASSGYVLRVRRKARRLEATLKELVGPPGGAPPAGAGRRRGDRVGEEGLRRRLEATEPLGAPAGRGAGDAGALAALGSDGPVGRRVSALVGTRRLRPVLEVRTRRRPFQLTVDGELVGELALDETSIAVGDDRTRLHLRRVEVEVQEDWVDALSPVIEQLRLQCGLQPAMLSKFEAGLMAAGIAVPRPGEGLRAAASPVTASSSVGEMAIAVVARDASALVSREAGTRLGEDPEELHQMRVATRRLRAALSLFAPVLPARAHAIRAELGWLAGLLGAVRDLDVQLADLPRHASALPPSMADAFVDLSAVLRRQRDVARSELLEALDSRRYERLVSALRTTIGQGPPRRLASARVPALVAVPGLIEQRHRAAMKAARKAERTGAMTDSHALRISCKRLRYALEFANGLYGGELRPFVKQLARLQDELGLVQDAETAYHRLQALALGETAAGGGPATGKPVASAVDEPVAVRSGPAGGSGGLTTVGSGTATGASGSPTGASGSPTGASGSSGSLGLATVFAMGMVAERCRADAMERLHRAGPGRKLLGSREWQSIVGLMTRRRSDAEAAMPAAPAAAAPAGATAGAGVLTPVLSPLRARQGTPRIRRAPPARPVRPRSGPGVPGAHHPSGASPSGAD